jgi:hypothetical protein
MIRRGNVAGLVHPVLDEVTGCGRAIDQVATMWTQPREQRQFLAPDENIDRIDLDDTHLPHDGAQMTSIDSRWRRRGHH